MRERWREFFCEVLNEDMQEEDMEVVIREAEDQVEEPIKKELTQIIMNLKKMY